LGRKDVERTERGKRDSHIVEGVSLGDDLGSRLADVERVTVDLVPVVIERMEEDGTADLRASSRGVVDVVAIESHEVVRAEEKDRPVVPEERFRELK
jgi:hypothetical protein